MQNIAYLRPVITNKCNNSCIFCSHDFNDQEQIYDMDDKWLCTVMKIFKEVGGQMVSFSGGEPLCHNSLISFMETAKTNNLKTRLTTNFILFDLSNYKLIENIDCVHISLPVIDNKSYSQITRTKSEFCFSDLLYKISYLISVGKDIRINSIYLEQYEQHIIDAINYFNDNNISVNVMNDMYGNKKYIDKYYDFCNVKLKAFKNVSFRTSTNPGWNICKDCDYRYNCASTRAIWCFPDYTIGLCPQKRIMRYSCESEKEIKSFLEKIISDSYYVIA